MQLIAPHLNAVGADALESRALQHVATAEVELTSILWARQDHSLDSAQRERSAIMRAGVCEGEEGAIDVDNAHKGALKVDSLHFAAAEIVPGCYYRHS